MDDWQDTAFQNRHVHNRIDRRGRGKTAPVFDVVKTFGTYEINCSAADKFSLEKSTNTRASRLEIYRLNESENALIGELWLSNILHASILLAGSRKTMNSVLQNFNMQSAADENHGDSKEHLGDKSEDSNGEDAGESETTADARDEQEERSGTRFKTFEKNSFRSPKFWLRWQGRVGKAPATTGEDDMDTGPGYLVFSGNDCNTFQGTISCEALGWKDVKMTGRKTASRSTRDATVIWQTSAV